MRNGEQTEEPIISELDGPSANGRGACGERALMRAVLVDAIRCVTGRAGGPDRVVVAQEARAWIEERDSQWPFSFENVCLELEIDTERLRRKVLALAAEVTLDEAPTRRVRGERPREEDIEALIRSGQPLRQVAQRFGISVAQVSTLSSGLATRLRRQRDEEIVRLHHCGWTHVALAAHFALSRIRVRRICAAGERRSPAAAAAPVPTEHAQSANDADGDTAFSPLVEETAGEDGAGDLWLSETASWPDRCDSAP